MSGILGKAEFEALVETLLAAGEVGSFGKLHIIRLAQPEGDPEWERRQPKIRAIAEAILGTRLNRDEAFFPCPNGHYLLIFPRLGEIEGAVRAAAIAREIRTRLFGETGQDFEVTTRVMPLSRLKPRSGANVEAMDKALGRSREKGRGKGGIVLDAMYQPVWDAQRETVIGNRETIRRKFAGRDLFGSAVLFGGEEDELAVEVNAVLRRGSIAAAAIPSTLFMPLVVNSLVLRNLDGIRAWVAEIARNHTGELIVELTGGVATTGRPRLRDLIRAVRGEGAEVAVQAVPDIELANALRDFGAGYLCVNLAQILNAGLTLSATVALFTVIAHEVRSIGMQLCLWNVTMPQEVKRSIPLGFRYFSGAMIGETVALPVKPHPFSAAQVYA